ncbi:MAG: hypothetical protein HY314_04570 [Acidobacteria bacterium]|nr:hypothetical protein [Acidobacteriota bacterium]
MTNHQPHLSGKEPATGSSQGAGRRGELDSGTGEPFPKCNRRHAGWWNAENSRSSLVAGENTATSDQRRVISDQSSDQRPATSDRFVRLEISDTGLGIEKDKLTRIFDPFFTTKEVGKGTGLGLSIVHGIIKEHRGTITVKSQPGVGTKFTILLPTEG